MVATPPSADVVEFLVARHETVGAQTAHQSWPDEVAQPLSTSLPWGPGPKPYIDGIGAGYAEVDIQQIGPERDRFFHLWMSKIALEFAA